MYRFVILIISLLLAGVPVAAQTSEPVLVPTQDVLDRIMTFVANVGAPWSIIIISIIVLSRLVAALGKPVSDALVKALETTFKAMERIAQSGEAMAVTMTKVETIEQAHAARTAAALMINTHTDEKIDPVVGELKTLSERMDKLATKDEVLLDMTEIRRQLDKIIRELEARGMGAFHAPAAEHHPAPHTDGKTTSAEA